MRKLFLFILITLLIGCSVSKNKEVEKPEVRQATIDPRYPLETGEEVYKVVAKMPEYPGGKEKIHEYLTANVKCLDTKRGFFIVERFTLNL